VGKRQRKRDRAKPFKPDLRGRVAQVAEDNEVAKAGHWIYVVQPVRAPDGRAVNWPHPLAPVLNLIAAQGSLDAGNKHLKRALADLVPGQRPGDPASFPITTMPAVFDAISELTDAVLRAYAAIESYVNEVAERLPESTTVSVKRKRDGKKELVPYTGEGLL
jgi:hypothetical protein